MCIGAIMFIKTGDANPIMSIYKDEVDDTKTKKVLNKVIKSIKDKEFVVSEKNQKDTK